MSGNKTRDKSHLAALGGVGAALAAGFCCIGAPLATAGMVGAAGIAVAIEPLRPVFLLLAAAFLMLAFRLDRKRRCDIATQAGGPLAMTSFSRREDVDTRSDPAASSRFLWVATALAIALASLPLWISLVR